jgi:hypothetical protein
MSTRRRIGLSFGFFLGAAALILAVLSTSCARPKVMTVPLAYATVTNKLTRMRPATGPDGRPRAVDSHEVTPGNFRYWLREPGGDIKLGPYTVIDVKAVDASATQVELRTGKYSLLLFGHYRHYFWRERTRWRELQEILRNDI